MTSLSIAILFTLLLALATALVWGGFYLRERMRRLDQRVSESLDGEDLIDFQERVAALLSEVRETGTSLISRIEAQRESLDTEVRSIKELEERLSDRKLKTLERASEVVRRIREAPAAQPPKEPTRARATKAAKATKGKAKPQAKKGKAAGKQSKPASRAAKPTLKPKVLPLSLAPVPKPKAPVVLDFKPSYLIREVREFKAPEPRAPVSPAASRYLKVYELADRGLSKEEIAKSSGYLPGEVELILNLRPKSKG